jgi:hypothetical protein
MRAIRTSIRRVSLAAVFLSSAGVASAQLPNASAAAFGMAGNFTAIARGYEAVAWNPANLAMPGRPFLSVGLGIAGGSVGLDPVDVKMLHDFSGRVIDSATKASWVDNARLSGGQRVRLDGGLTPLAFSLGPIGFQVGGSAYSTVNFSADAWELFLFGNAGNSGNQPKTIDLSGTRASLGVVSAAAMSFAMPVPINLTGGLFANERAAIGITGKYVMGNSLVLIQDDGSVLGGSDLELRLPAIIPDSNYNGTLGNGTGMDLSLAWSGGPWKIGVLAENVFNTFRWDTTTLASVSGTGLFSGSSGSDNSVDFEDQQSFSAAPAALRDAVTKQQFKPAVTIGGAFNVMPSLTLTADMKTSLGGDEAIVIGPKSRFGVGAEWRVIPIIPLRAGVASVTDGWQAGAGIGVRLLGYEFGLSTSIRRRGQANESGMMFGVVGIGR